MSDAAAPLRVSGQVGMLAASAAMAPTVTGGLTPVPAPTTVRPGALEPTATKRKSVLRWAGGSIGYIYVYMRGKQAAGERRRRLIDERDGAQALLAGTVRELGGIVLREKIQHPDLAALLESIARAEARRQAAHEDTDASEKQRENEESHLLTQEASAEMHWRTSDAAARDAEELLSTVDADVGKASSRLTKVRDERARLEREADAAAQAPDGKSSSASRAAGLRHEAQGLATELGALEERLARLEREQAELREKSSALRSAATAARTRLEQAGGARRQAASAMVATIAGHARDRAEAERAIADLTEQLGRATSQARPPAEPLLSAYQRIDRLQETIADRTINIADIERSSAHYDMRKLLTGVGLLTGMLLATATALWAVLK
jgi:hypothetical protein